ncbi:hypothetical protein [Pedobacter sp. Leaf250]|uniref:hypothetical protein n=1 Tax=Pedobacter sp. Leaf250 TaxID=2876559 RepID=UPI001E401488|nr:hypothetical protein [Pedobacter sp. Leaf250]
MSKYYFTPAGNRQIALALNNTAYDDFNFQHDHKSEDPTDLIFIPYFPTDTDTALEVFAKSKYLAMLIGGSFNIATHEKGSSLDITLDWLIDWEKEKRVQIVNPEDIIPINPYSQAELFDRSKAIDYRREDFVKYAIYLSKYDRFVNSLLLLASQKHSFISLHALLDTIETKAKFPLVEDKKLTKEKREQRIAYILEKSEVTINNINAFTGTANNYGMLGLQSRHGDMGRGKPAKTMDLATSTKMILKLAYFTIYHHIELDEI